MWKSNIRLGDYRAHQLDGYPTAKESIEAILKTAAPAQATAKALRKQCSPVVEGQTECLTVILRALDCELHVRKD